MKQQESKSLVLHKLTILQIFEAALLGRNPTSRLRKNSVEKRRKLQLA